MRIAIREVPMALVAIAIRASKADVRGHFGCPLTQPS